MEPDFSDLPPRFLNTVEAARFLSLSRRTLEKLRCYGGGPVYRKLGGRVVYAMADIQAWADQGRVVSTSDPRGTILPVSRHEKSSKGTGKKRGRKGGQNDH